MTASHDNSPDITDTSSGDPGRVERRGAAGAEMAGMRVDRAAAALFEDFSRALLTQWIQAGALTVDGATVKPGQRLKGGEILELAADLVPREQWRAADPVAFDVALEDAALLVVDKPAGLVVHPGAGNPRRTLVNGLLMRYPELATLPRAGIVHRLDKDTSGLLLVARTLAAHKTLTAAMARRAVARRYLAVVEGRLAGDLTIDQPVGRDPVRRTRQAVRVDGRAALTHVRVVERFRAHSLVEATLETGRTHQIRVHLASVGHPLVGDTRYGARRRVPVAADTPTVDMLRRFARQALHAWKLGFAHPDGDRQVRVESPLPGDMTALVERLQADAAGAAGGARGR